MPSATRTKGLSELTPSREQYMSLLTLLYPSLKTTASAPVRQAGPSRQYRPEESARSCLAGAVAPRSRPTLARQAKWMALLSGSRGLSPVRRLHRQRGALRQDMDSSKRASQLVVLARCSALDPLRRPMRWSPGRSSLLGALQRPQTTTAGSGANDRLQKAQRALLRRLAASTVLQSSWAYLQRRPDLRAARALLRGLGEADWAAFAKQRKGVFEVVRSGRWCRNRLGWTVRREARARLAEGGVERRCVHEQEAQTRLGNVIKSVCRCAVEPPAKKRARAKRRV